MVTPRPDSAGQGDGPMPDRWNSDATRAREAAEPGLRHAGRDPAELGDVVRSFRVRPRFFTSWMNFLLPLTIGGTVAMFVNGVAVAGVLGLLVIGGVLLARIAAVGAERPVAGWPTYLVFTHGLVVQDEATQVAIRWEDVESVRHRPMAIESYGTVTGTWSDHCVLTLAGVAEPLMIANARRQHVLSRLIIDATRDTLLQRLLQGFESNGTVVFGELVLTPDHVRGQDGAELPWRSDWSYRTMPRPRGWELTIQDPDKQRLTAWVPEATLARELLGTLNASLAH